MTLFPWADFPKTKAGIKVSVKLDHLGKIPVFVLIENARKHESRTVEDIPLETDDIVVFDLGYNNYSYFASLCNRKIYFVTASRFISASLNLGVAQTSSKADFATFFTSGVVCRLS